MQGAPWHAVRILLLVAAGLALCPAGARGDDCERVAIWRDGKRTGMGCRSDAVAHGLTVLDLSDTWVPPVLADTPDGVGPRYRATYLALAEERFGDAGLDGVLAASDRHLELYGIAPGLGVVRDRLADDARHACHAGIDDVPLAAAPPRIVEIDRVDAVARISAARALRTDLEGDRARRKLPDLAALAAADRYHQRQVERLAALDAYLDAIRTVQAHLACDRLFRYPPVDAGYTWPTSNAVASFQRGAMILPTSVLDAATLEAFALDSRERDFRTALRVLRERVVAATGLIEDGSAGAGPGTVLDRTLEPEGTWHVRGHEPLDGAAPDLISPATEAVARALGWRDPEATLAFLAALASPEATTSLVAVALPPRPAYHGPAMELMIEIDRGDVWYDPVPRWRDAPRRPALVLYAIDSGRRIPLARYPTTIGGWQDEQRDGSTSKQWKESPSGPRIWRDLFVGPSWLPPVTTPDRELVRGGDGHYALAREQLGPSYRAAFGMIAFVHLVESIEHGEPAFDDQGIRTHGTGNLTSLASGVSHGCHRVLGRNMVRLADFVLAHRDHVRRGEAPTFYRRIVQYGGSFPIAIDSLGYQIELVPPISVEVLPGRIHR